MSDGGALTFLRPGVLLVGVLVPFAVKQAWVFLAADFTCGSLFTVFSHVPLGQTPETKSFTFKELDSLFVWQTYFVSCAQVVSFVAVKAWLLKRVACLLVLQVLRHPLYVA